MTGNEIQWLNREYPFHVSPINKDQETTDLFTFYPNRGVFFLIDWALSGRLVLQNHPWPN